MIRIGLQDLAIDVAGSVEPAGSMVLNCDRKCFGNRCHGGRRERS